MNIRERLADRISEDYCLIQENARTKALEILANGPSQLLPNVEQWSNRKKITDIYVGKYSIPMIMEIWGRQDFISALEIITEYLNGDCDMAERRIWQTRR